MAGGGGGGGDDEDDDDDYDDDDDDDGGGGRPPPPPLTLARCLFHAGEARRQNGEFRAANAFLEEAAVVVAAAMESFSGEPLRTGLPEYLSCTVAFRSLDCSGARHQVSVKERCLVQERILTVVGGWVGDE